MGANLRTIPAAASEFIKEGFYPLPIPAGQKKCVVDKWSDLRITESKIPQYFDDDGNIGLLLGEPSDDLVDIDLDAPEARAVALEWLPETHRVHGRVGSPQSHRHYRAHPAPRTTQFADTDGTMLCELRGTGGQTMVPPSVHPNGEAIVWYEHGDRAEVDPQALLDCVKCVAVSAVLARHWPARGSRHKTALALAGVLLREGVSKDIAERLIKAAATAAGDDEVEDRVGAVAATAAQLADGKDATGGPTLSELLVGDGAKVVDRIRKWLYVESGLPALDAGDRHVRRASAAAWEALIQANDPPSRFRFGGVAVRAEGDHLPPILTPYTQDRLCYDMARCADYFRTTKDGRVPAVPPTHVLKDMLAHPIPPLPLLTRIIASPVMTADGRILSAAGYDAQSGLYYAPAAGFSMPVVPDVPSADEIAAARRLLVDDLFGDFPFVGPSERAHAVALLLQPFVRDLIDGPTPLHLIEKPSPGTGASLLIEVIALTTTGASAPMMSEADNEAEWRKRITAALLESPSLVVIDNLRRKLDSAALSSALTASVWKDRRLGVSEMIRVPVQCGWGVSGNNPVISLEIARRTVRIRLDAKVERPWLRQETTFRHPDLRQWVREHRGALVAAALTLVRAWTIAGRPAGARTLGMFESWAKVIGGLLDVAQVPGFLGNLEPLYDQSDVENGSWREFVKVWWDAFHDAPVTVAGLWPLLNPAVGDPIDLGLGKGDERSLKTRFGLKLVQARDRRFGRYQLAAAGTVKHAKAWRLVSEDDAQAPTTPVENDERLLDDGDADAWTKPGAETAGTRSAGNDGERGEPREPFGARAGECQGSGPVPSSAVAAQGSPRSQVHRNPVLDHVRDPIMSMPLEEIRHQLTSDFGLAEQYAFSLPFDDARLVLEREYGNREWRESLLS